VGERGQGLSGAALSGAEGVMGRGLP